jgi:hypothetical protein
MSCKFTCDGCGEEEMGEHANGNWFKPRDWYVRSDKDGPQVACSRRCIETVASRSGKTGCVLPI